MSAMNFVRIVVIQHLVLLTQSIQCDVKISFFRDQIMGVILSSSPLMVIPSAAGPG